MKKIVGISAVVILLVSGYMGFNYWNDAYNGKTAYALIPEEIPEKEQTKNMNGNIQQGFCTYNYELRFAKENGEVKTMKYSISGTPPEPLTSNSYVKAKISKKRVTSGPSAISEADIPSSLEEILDR